jgi:competence protein ComEA
MTTFQERRKTMNRSKLLSKIAGVAFALVMASSLSFGQASSTKSKPAKEPPAAGTSTKHEPLDLNSATKEQLTTVPGIDAAMADKIIAGRPYKSKAELKSKKIVSASTYNQISSHVIAKHSK